MRFEVSLASFESVSKVNTPTTYPGLGKWSQRGNMDSKNTYHQDYIGWEDWLHNYNTCIQGQNTSLRINLISKF